MIAVWCLLRIGDQMEDSSTDMIKQAQATISRLELEISKYTLGVLSLHCASHAPPCCLSLQHARRSKHS